MDKARGAAVSESKTYLKPQIAKITLGNNYQNDTKNP